MRYCHYVSGSSYVAVVFPRLHRVYHRIFLNACRFSSGNSGPVRIVDRKICMAPSCDFWTCFRL